MYVNIYKYIHAHKHMYLWKRIADLSCVATTGTGSDVYLYVYVYVLCTDASTLSRCLSARHRRLPRRRRLAQAGVRRDRLRDRGRQEGLNGRAGRRGRGVGAALETLRGHNKQGAGHKAAYIHICIYIYVCNSRQRSQAEGVNGRACRGPALAAPSRQTRSHLLSRLQRYYL